MTLVQSQSTGGLRIETSINKTLNDFNSAMDRQDAGILRTLNAETVAFERDAKSAILYMLLTSYYVANYGVTISAAMYVSSASDFTVHITEGATTLKDKINPDKLKTDVKAVIDDYKSKMDTPITEIREKMRTDVEANPDKLGCYEKILKDITAMGATTTKNVTDSFTFSNKDFKLKAVEKHANINTNVTEVLKKSYACLALRRDDLVFTCTDKLVAQSDKVRAFIEDRLTEIGVIYTENQSNLSLKTQKVGDDITAQKEAIMAKIDLCTTPARFYNADPEITVEMANPDITAEVANNV